MGNDLRGIVERYRPRDQPVEVEQAGRHEVGGALLRERVDEGAEDA